MATWDPPPNIPSLIHHRRFTRNGRQVQADYYGRVARAQNHIVAYRRKWIAGWSQPLTGLATRVSTVDLPGWRTYFRSGHGVDHIEVNLTLGYAWNGSGAAFVPQVYAKLKNPSTGADVVTSAVIDCPISSSSSYGPDTWSHAKLTLACSDDTAYWLQLYLSDYARIIAAEAHEVAVIPVDDTVTGAVDPRYSVGTPIWDGAMASIAEAQTEVLRSNRRHLVSWSCYDGVSAVTNATGGYLNIVDGVSTTWAVASPGWRVQNLYCNTYGRTAVPVIFAAYAVNTVHSANSTVRLGYESSEDVGPAITDIDGTAGWHAVASSINPYAASNDDGYFQAFSLNGAGSTVRVDAIAILEYE